MPLHTPLLTPTPPGDYVNSPHLPGKSLVSCFDLARGEWTSLEPPLDPKFIEDAAAEGAQQQQTPIAFVPVGAVEGRLVMLVEGLPLAFNPLQPEMGWRLCASSLAEVKVLCARLDLGTSACACVQWGRHLVISAGRNGRSEACHVAAFSFLHPRESSKWMLGRFASLGATGETGRVGAGLAVVHDRLYISGGVHEGNGIQTGFDESVACWEGSRADLPGVDPPPSAISVSGGPDDDDDPPAASLGRDAAGAIIDVSHRQWRQIEGLNLPTAMHAHEAISIPFLPHLGRDV